jgi:hypothetical protein
LCSSFSKFNLRKTTAKLFGLYSNCFYTFIVFGLPSISHYFTKEGENKNTTQATTKSNGSVCIR